MVNRKSFILEWEIPHKFLYKNIFINILLVVNVVQFNERKCMQLFSKIFSEFALFILLWGRGGSSQNS